MLEPDQHPSKVPVNLEDEKPVWEGRTGPFRITLSLLVLVTGRNKSNFSPQERLKLSEVPAMSWEDISDPFLSTSFSVLEML